MLYTRGGIKPVSAAIDELAKLLLVRIAVHRDPRLEVPGHGLMRDLIVPKLIRKWENTEPAKAAFKTVIRLSHLGGSLPDGTSQAVWPDDEPLRITRVDILAEAFEVLEQIDLEVHALGGVDPLGTAFDTFLQGRFDHAGGLGTYLTPATVARTMATIAFDLCDGEPEIIGDPCCGTGRFLAAMVAERLRRSLESDLGVVPTSGIFGADQSPNSVAMARVNLLAYGANQPLVFTVRDSITDTAIDHLSGRVDLILANPPFGDSKYDDPDGIVRTSTTIPSVTGRDRIDPALAFVARCIDLLAPRGIAGIVLPDGVLDSTAMRGTLLSSTSPAEVLGILSLPSATFAPGGTTAKTSVLFIRKGLRTSPRVFIAKAEHVGYLKQKNSVIADPDGNDLPQIRAEVSKIIGDLESSPLASPLTAFILPDALTSLDASSYNLNAIDARAELTRLGGKPFNTFLSSEPQRRRSNKGTDLPFVSVLHVDELGGVDWVSAETYRPKTPGKIAPSGAVLVSLLNPAKFRATVVPENYEVVFCSSEFGVFRSDEDPYATLALLQHPLVRAQIAPLGRGTSSSRRRVVDEDVLGLIAPPFDSFWIEEAGSSARRYYEALDSARRGLRNLFT